MNGKETDTTVIPQLFRVFYLAFGNFPLATAVKVGECAYATDRLVLYRSNGLVWQAITIHSSSGAFADRPAAADLPNGSIYFSTDTTTLSQVQAGAWADIAATVNAGIWILHETLSPSGVATITSNALAAAHDLIMVLFELVLDTGAEAEHQLNLRFNADVANNYADMYVDNVAIIVETGQAQMRVGSAWRVITAGVYFPIIGQLLIEGKSKGGGALTRIAVTGMTGTSSVDENRLLQGNWKCVNIDVSTMTFFSTVNFTGKIKIYYMDF